ncbi:9425_t:CDS:1 [Ambispora leptoticha]|uniref:9425_t:CDS:1 n=1 Tax=Ambispora leptoticha TaxID=144679 RepID=A0A9N9FZU7_9GLOM|nr:9425_t:CDS:1 [Ambispora leptoticha]
MSSLGISPFLDFTGLLMFVEKFSIYLVIGATFYFSRTTKQDIDAKHNSDLSTRDTMFNEILANRDARLTTELADRDARFVTELTDYRAKFNAELTSRDEKFTAEVQRIFTMLNTSAAKFGEIEQVLQTYHNNFGRVATEFESINGGISTLQNEINRYYAVVQARSVVSPEIRIEPIEEVELQDNNSSSSDQ